MSVQLVASFERELYNWVVLLSSCSASSDLWGLKIAGGEAVRSSSLSKRAEEGAGVKNVVMDEYSFWPHGSGETMTGLNHLAWTMVEVCRAQGSSSQVLPF